MRVKLAQEMWVVNGELMLPWVTMRDGPSCRGIAQPSPIVIERGAEVEIELEPEKQCLGCGWHPSTCNCEELYGRADRGYQQPDEIGERNELLRDMGHDQIMAGEERGGLGSGTCACSCKGCHAGKHCNDTRCWPLE